MISAQEFVPEVAVAVLQVYKIKAALLGQMRCPAERPDDADEFVIRNRRHVDAGWVLDIQNRMVIGNDRLQTRFLARPAETSGVGKLKADDKVRALAEAFMVSLDHLAAQFRKSGGGSLVQKQLTWVAPRFGKHRHGFASPDQFGAAHCEPHPAPAG